jgi:hypothetical protein
LRTLTKARLSRDPLRKEAYTSDRETRRKTSSILTLIQLLPWLLRTAITADEFPLGLETFWD